jgi:3-phenylpropionate/trans-cinnamate dioxygenase ferredoxin subunit
VSRVRVCGWSELADGTPRRVEVDGRAVALVRIGEQVHAIDDTCTHAEVSLSEGDVDLEECALECWKHGSLFDLRTGEALTLPALKPVAVHTVTVEGDEVLVELSEGGSR